MNKIILILKIIIILFWVWFIASYAEILSQNLGENPQYSFWNIFAIIFL